MVTMVMMMVRERGEGHEVMGMVTHERKGNDDGTGDGGNIGDGDSEDGQEWDGGRCEVEMGEM